MPQNMPTSAIANSGSVIAGPKICFSVIPFVKLKADATNKAKDPTHCMILNTFILFLLVFKWGINGYMCANFLGTYVAIIWGAFRLKI